MEFNRYSTTAALVLAGGLFLCQAFAERRAKRNITRTQLPDHTVVYKETTSSAVLNFLRPEYRRIRLAYPYQIQRGTTAWYALYYDKLALLNYSKRQTGVKIPRRKAIGVYLKDIVEDTEEIQQIMGAGVKVMTVPQSEVLSIELKRRPWFMPIYKRVLLKEYMKKYQNVLREEKIPLPPLGEIRTEKGVRLFVPLPEEGAKFTASKLPPPERLSKLLESFYSSLRKT